MEDKVQKYFRILHPDFDTLSLEEQFVVLRDQIFIADHLEEIDQYYEGSMQEKSGARQAGLTEREIVENAMRVAKIESFFKKLYPEFEKLTKKEQSNALNDKVFIVNHIDEISKYYEEYKIATMYDDKQYRYTAGIDRARNNAENLI